MNARSTSHDCDHTRFDDALVDREQGEPMTPGRCNNELIGRVGMESPTQPRALDGHGASERENGHELARFQLFDALVDALRELETSAFDQLGDLPQ